MAVECNSFGNIDPVGLPPTAFCDRWGTFGSDCNTLTIVSETNEDAKYILYQKKKIILREKMWSIF